MDDATLVAAARSGDDTAWAAIYDRYADKLHDHCHRILRDRDEAADALHDGFVAAARNLHQLRDPERLRPWLYSICRHTSLRRLKARDKVDLTDTVDELMAPEADLDHGVRAEELSELVWAAAAGLSGRDQALLDLNLRQGLEGQDLADAMGTSLNNSYVMLSRMRDQVERSLGALLIARVGREDCTELDGILAGWDGRFSPLLRKRVARHVDGCDTCSERRRSAVSPLALLALAPLVPAPSLLKTRVISSIRNVDVVDPPHVPFTKAGFAALGPGEDGSRPKALWLLGAAAIVLLFGGIFLGFHHSSGTAVVTAGSASSTQPGTRTSATDATTTTSIDTSGSTTVLGDSTTTVFTAGGGSGGSTGTTGGGGGSTPTTAPPATTTTVSGPPVIGAPSATDSGCGGGRTVTVYVTVTDAHPVTVTLITPYGTSPMHGSGSSYSATVGAPSAGGTLNFVVKAVDSLGHKAPNKVGSINLPSCDTTTTTAPPTTTTTTTVRPPS